MVMMMIMRGRQCGVRKKHERKMLVKWCPDFQSEQVDDFLATISHLHDITELVLKSALDQ